VDSIDPDHGLEAGRRLLDTAGRSEADKNLRSETETSESETIHREAIAWDIVPYGVGLKGRPRLLDRRCRTRYRIGGRWRTRSQHENKACRETQRDE